MYDSSLCCLVLKMPYKLFRTSYSHNSALHSHIVKLTIHFYAHIRSRALSHKTSHVQAHRGFRLVPLASYNSSLIPSAIALRIMQQEVAPASSTPLDLSPRRLERPNFATMSLVESRPASAAFFISASACLKSFPSALAAFFTSTDGASVSTNVLSQTFASTIPYSPLRPASSIVPRSAAVISSRSSPASAMSMKIVP